MDISFCDYLEAKYALDERSLNSDVRALFQSVIGSFRTVRILDIGCGLGASVKRLMAIEQDVHFDVTAVDFDEPILQSASVRVVHVFRQYGYDVIVDNDMIRAVRNRQTFTIRFVGADLLHFAPDSPGQYDVVMAHALMDLLPPSVMVQRVFDWLGPGGLFYASLNYDGGTTLLPPYSDLPLERDIFLCYDASMERMIGNQVCGGAQSGRRLHAALMNSGYEVLAYGSSDWNITPYLGDYRDADQDCLLALLGMIRNEAYRSHQFDGETLQQWYDQRNSLIESGQLGLIIHQLDILARKPGAPA